MPFVNLGESLLAPAVRLWCNADDHWGLKFDMTKQINEAFGKKGVSIPHLHSVEIQKSA